MKKECKFVKPLFFSALVAGSIGMAGCSSSGDDPGANTDTSTTPSSNENPAINPPPSNNGSQPANPPDTGNQAENSFAGRTRGRVEQVNSDGSLVVLGQTVFISGNTVLVDTTQNQIVVGDWIDVLGQIDGQGNVYATSIDLDLNLDNTVVVTGLISALDFAAGTLQIGSLTVAIGKLDFSSLDLSGFIDGLVIEITGDYGDYNSGNVSISANGISVTQTDGTSVVVGPGNSDPVIVPEPGTNENPALPLLSLTGASSCLTVGENATFQVQTQSPATFPGLDISNLNALASVTAGNSSSLTVVSAGDAGVSIKLTSQDIVEMEVTAGNVSVKQYIGALDPAVQKPVILARQTSNWCSYILFEENGCVSITNSIGNSEGVAVNASGTTGPAKTGESLLVRTLGNGTLVSTGRKISVDGCQLDNPLNFPVLTVN